MMARPSQHFPNITIERISVEMAADIKVTESGYGYSGRNINWLKNTPQPN